MLKISIGRPIDADMSPEVSALHEAGHAVIATHLGLEVAHVEIFGDGHGETATYADTCPNDDHRWALVACAGAVSEGVSWINEGDFTGVKDAGYSEDDLSNLFEETRTFVDKHKEDILKVSKSLLKRKKMSGKSVRQMCRI